MKKIIILGVVLLLLGLPQLAQAATVPPVAGLATGEPGPVLERVTLVPEKEQIRLELFFNEEIEYTSMVWQNPFRVVVDIKNGSYRNWFTQLDKKDWLFRQVRIFENRFGLRIVLELKMVGPEYLLSWNPAQKKLLLTMPRRFTVLSTTTLVEGVEYLQIQRGLPEGLAQAWGLQVDVPETTARKFYPQVGSEYVDSALILKTAYGEGNSGLRGLSTVSDLVRQEGGLGGINGGFFAGDGLPLGLLIRDGKLVSQPLYNRTAWGIDADGRMRIAAVELDAEATIGGQVVPISGLNRVRATDELIVYSPEFGPTTRTNEWGFEVQVQNGQVIATGPYDSPVPPDGWVLSGHGKYKALLEQLQVGDPVEVRVSLKPDWLSERVQYAFGGGPRLLKDGRIAISGPEEKFKSDILVGRAPRTALGITPDQQLLMLVVDGRSEASIGMSLQELAELLLELGAVDAMNLDGGKSSTLVIGGQIRNAPSAGQEIPVHNGLILLMPVEGKLD